MSPTIKSETRAIKGVRSHLGEVADGLHRLLTYHLRLARLELREDARAMGKSLAGVSLFGLFAIIGYAFLCAGLALLLARRMPAEFAFLVIGGINLVGGAVGIYFAARSLNGEPTMNDTVMELKASTSTISAMPKTQRREHSHAQ